MSESELRCQNLAVGIQKLSDFKHCFVWVIRCSRDLNWIYCFLVQVAIFKIWI